MHQIREKHTREKCEKNSTSYQSSVENITSDLVEKLREVSLNSEHREIFSNDLTYKKTKKPVPSYDTSLKSISNRTRKQSNHKKSTLKKIEKKNSFIVSDSSSVTDDDDGIAQYHRALTKQIREDVAKITPRHSAKKHINHEDDGIFTPYIICRRSDTSYSDSSDKENYNSSILTEKKYSVKENIIKPKFSSDSDKDSKSNIYGSDSDSFKSAINELSPVIKSPKDNFLEKNVSWCFSDKETSSESEADDEKTADHSTPVKAPRKKNSVSTPITFRLNNLKNLTPTPERLRTPDEKQESWLFLRSLSNCPGKLQIHPQAEQYGKKFKKLKGQLAEKLFNLFNEEIFNNKLPSDLKIEWSGRMRSTSGFCYNKRIKTTIGPNNECPRSSRIVLSTKIIETPERLRDTLIHEMCHAAAWVIDNKADGHGPCWKSWVSKVHRKFPELPPIKRCHDYSIKTKFKYRCVNCGYTIGRHSKSLNLERKRCGYCYGKFELLLHNELKSDSIGNSPKNVKARPLSKFALFVKDNYGKVKSENASLKHGDIMKILSKNFAETKISN